MHVMPTWCWRAGDQNQKARSCCACSRTGPRYKGSPPCRSADRAAPLEAGPKTEHPAGDQRLDIVEAIAAVEGIDMNAYGRSDLSARMKSALSNRSGQAGYYHK